MADTIIGIADLKITNREDDVLVTYSLGSCLGITGYDPLAKVGGLIHIMLPDSTIDVSADKNLYKYVDTGIPQLFKECYKLGAVKQRMIVKIAGGAQIMDNNGFFNIGQRNLAAARKMLWKNNVLVSAEDVGGSISRTIRLYMTTGELQISTGMQKVKMI